MAQTRSPASKKAQSSPQSANKPSAGTKRKADDVAEVDDAQKKRGKAQAEKEQKTLEEMLPADEIAMAEVEEEEKADEKEKEDEEADEQEKEGEANGKAEEKEEPNSIEETKGEDASSDEKKENGDSNAHSKPEKESGSTTKKDEASKDEPSTAAADASNDEKAKDAKGNSTTTTDAVKTDSAREAALPSNVLEKGLIYFFSRGRVGLTSPDSVQDLARSYCVLRPLPASAKLSDGTIADRGNNRVLALPKKVWPTRGSERFMAFVEKAASDLPTLKKEFFSGEDYETKTAGERHTPEVTPVGEGVYAFTSSGGGEGTSHLVYRLTIPAELGDVQTDLGIKAKGAFVVSLKNPEAKGPSYATLPQKAEFPTKVIEEFRGRNWMPARPELLDYANVQVLLIGEDFESGDALQVVERDGRDDEKISPGEELEKLEGEDEHRVDGLKGSESEAIFADLELESKEYPKVLTTW